MQIRRLLTDALSDSAALSPLRQRAPLDTAPSAKLAAHKSRKSKLLPETPPTCVRVVPSIQSKDEILSYRDHRWLRQLLEGVGSQVDDRAIGDEFHQHAQVILASAEHQRSLKLV